MRHGAQGQRIDINTERDEGMFAILEKQKRGSFRTGPEGAQSASVNIRGTSVEVMEVEARQWLSAVLRSGGKEGGADKLDGVGGVPPPLQEVLKDGVMLCDLMNVLHKPPSTADGASSTAAAHLEAGCPAPSTSHLPFKQMENIAAYLAVCDKLGVPKHSQFQTVDLYENKNMMQVITNIHALGAAAQAPAAERGARHRRGGRREAAVGLGA